MTASPRKSPRIGDGVFEAEASTPLDVLAEATGLELPETDAETVGGLILDLLGRLAKPGDSVEVSGHRLIVVRADPTRIRRIRIEPLKKDEAGSHRKEKPKASKGREQNRRG